MRASVLAVALLFGMFAPSAFALPTMIRLGYVNCAACHIAPQGGGLLNTYGKGIDQAQSLRAGEYVPSASRLASALSWGGRITQDLRLVGQETVSGSTSGPILGALRTRFMYRNNTELGRGIRLSGVVVDALRHTPDLAYDPPVHPAQVYVTQALVSYRAGKNLEISAGRDALPQRAQPSRPRHVHSFPRPIRFLRRAHTGQGLSGGATATP